VLTQQANAGVPDLIFRSNQLWCRSITSRAFGTPSSCVIAARTASAAKMDDLAAIHACHRPTRRSCLDEFLDLWPRA
jgi:hypothetical protein